MKPRLYLETSVVSFLTARLARDVIASARQELTRKWWDTRRGDFDLIISQAVLDETAGGDPEAAVRRVHVLQNLPVMPISEEVIRFAATLKIGLQLPA